MNSVKISIITCCFNSFKTIDKTLESIKKQTYKNYELIIIDGESTDETLNIINNYKDIISILISEADKGVYDAMNKGIKLATGDVLGFLNSDDFYFHDNVLKDIAASFQEEKIDVSYGNMYYVERDNISKKVRKWISGEFTSNYLKNGWIPGHPTFYVKKNIYDKVGGFNLTFKLAADYELMLKILSIKNLKIKYFNSYQVVMRLGGMTSKNIANRIKQNIEILHAWKVNDLNPGIFFFLRRLIIKVKQLQ